MTLRACLLALSLGLSLPLQAATELIQLNYRTAEDVLPVVQSALDGQGKVSPYGNQLVINASPEKIQEVRDLLQKGDTSVDPETRKEAYGKALALIAERAYAVPLYSLPVYYVAAKDLEFKAYADEMPRFWEMTWN